MTAVEDEDQELAERTTDNSPSTGPVTSDLPLQNQRNGDWRVRGQQQAGAGEEFGERFQSSRQSLADSQSSHQSLADSQSSRQSLADSQSSRQSLADS